MSSLHSKTKLRNAWGQYEHDSTLGSYSGITLIRQCCLNIAGILTSLASVNNYATFAVVSCYS